MSRKRSRSRRQVRTFAPARREGSKPRPRWDKIRGKRGSSENHEVNDRDDPEPEQECVSLDVADLKQPQERPNTEGGAAYAAYRPAVNDISVDQLRAAAKQFLRVIDQPGVELIEIQSASNWIAMQQLAIAISICEKRATNAAEERGNRECRNDHARVTFLWDNKKILRDGRETGYEGKKGEDHQRNGHDERRFVSGAG